MSRSDVKHGGGFGRRLRSIPPHTWVGLVIAVIALVFVLQNRQEASISLFNVLITAPLWMTLLITLLIGFLVGLLIRRNRRTRKP